MFEMGMNHAGEIAALTRLVRPHVALVTAIAPAHIENLGGDEAIADAKARDLRGAGAGRHRDHPLRQPAPRPADRGGAAQCRPDHHLRPRRRRRPRRPCRQRRRRRQAGHRGAARARAELHHLAARRALGVQRAGRARRGRGGRRRSRRRRPRARRYGRAEGPGRAPP